MKWAVLDNCRFVAGEGAYLEQRRHQRRVHRVVYSELRENLLAQLLLCVFLRRRQVTNDEVSADFTAKDSTSSHGAADCLIKNTENEL